MAERALTEAQKIAIRKMAGGVPQIDIANELEISDQTICGWKKKKAFKKELEFRIAKRDELLDAELREISSLIGGRLREIVEHGKDVDSLSAIDKLFRIQGKFDDKLTVVSEEGTVQEQVDEYITNLERSYDIKIDRGPIGVVDTSKVVKRFRAVIKETAG